MNSTILLPQWITTLIIIFVFGINLFLKHRSLKSGLTQQIMLASVTESIGAVLAALLCANILYRWNMGDMNIPADLFKLPDSYLIIALYLLVNVLNFIRVNWKRWKKGCSK